MTEKGKEEEFVPGDVPEFAGDANNVLDDIFEGVEERDQPLIDAVADMPFKLSLENNFDIEEADREFLLAMKEIHVTSFDFLRCVLIMNNEYSRTVDDAYELGLNVKIPAVYNQCAMVDNGLLLGISDDGIHRMTLEEWKEEACKKLERALTTVMIDSGLYDLEKQKTIDLATEEEDNEKKKKLMDMAIEYSTRANSLRAIGMILAAAGDVDTGISPSKIRLHSVN